MNSTVALVGTGLIGRGWAILFANAGYTVQAYDADPRASTVAHEAIAANLDMLLAEGMIASTRELSARISFLTSMETAVRGASYVQESVTEDIEIKRTTFEKLSRLCGPDVILASSCSSISPERFMATAVTPGRCLIAHPFSPPHLIPLVEIVPTRWTSEQTLSRTHALMAELGQEPVRIHKSVTGFVVNRLQAAVINEALHLVADGVIEPSDLDRCMSHGLGLRWAFIGPFETMELNAANGFRDYVSKFGNVYRAILDDMGIRESWSKAAIDAVELSRRAMLPDLSRIPLRQLWRDNMLVKLAKLFRGAHLGRA